jgi:ribosomal protein S18 acetylase RimI-like enzyme
VSLALAPLRPDEYAASCGELAEVLHACVQDGASVGFVHPFARTEALSFWQELAGTVASGERLVLVARMEGRIAGTAQLILAQQPNGRHRAEVSKVLVHPEWRRRGIAQALMRAVEDEARRRGRSLLVLDTKTGSAAQALYAGLGWQRVGEIPNYAADVDGPLISTTLMYREVRTDAV